MMDEIILPNTNRKEWWYKYRNIVIFFGIILIGWGLKFHELLYLEILLGVLFSVIVLSTIEYKRQNIKNVTFKNDVIFVKYNDKVIDIPIRNIDYISSGIVQVPYLKKNLLIQVEFSFNRKYYFGRKLTFSYTFKKDYLTNPEKFPEDISIIKKRLKDLKPDE